MGRKPVVGLVGGIGAGKSTAAAAFARRGGVVIDADALGHEALESPDVRAWVLARWADRGPLLRPDGRLNRSALAKIVFADEAERRALQEQVFPHITRRVEEEVARAECDPKVRFVLLDAAVMLEAGWNNACDHLVYVDAPPEVRYTRLAARSGWTEEDVRAREAAQMPADEKRRHADAHLLNDGSAAALQERVDLLLEKWGLLERAGGPPVGEK